MKRVVRSSTWFLAVCFSFVSLPARLLSAQDASTMSVAPPAVAREPIWAFGGYVEGGFAPDYYVGTLTLIRYRKEQEFYATAFEAGRVLTGQHGRSILSGRLQEMVEITPFWLTHSPAQQDILSSDYAFLNGIPGSFEPYSIHGLSFTPVLPRWNFEHSKSPRTVPWIEAGIGVLWTAKTFPQGQGLPGTHTSDFNFSPQAAVGQSFFVRRNQSLNLGLHVVSYRNFGLGEIDPGVPYTLNFRVGYSWWK